jgi:acetoin utilization protein AcuC
MSSVPSTPDRAHDRAELVLVHDDAYQGWVFHPSHPTQGRRFANGRDRIMRLAADTGVHVEQVGPRPATRDELSLVHTEDYLREVLDEHRCDEWADSRPDLSSLAALFAGGTLVALDALLSRRTSTAVHLPGAKHHAQADRSSGFCVLADFALAATLAARAGLRVTILDIDAHHGDGTENLTAHLPDVCTVSIHQAGIFPGTGLSSDPARHVHNLPLAGGAGDDGLITAAHKGLDLMQQFDPDLVMLAAGADGHTDDPLSSLDYSTAGYREVARLLRQAFPTRPVLIGGAGGYRPDDATPDVWAHVAIEAAITASHARSDGSDEGAGSSTDSAVVHFGGQHTIIDPTPIEDVLPGEVAAVVRDLVPGVVATRAGTDTHHWAIFGEPMFWLRDRDGHRIAMCTRTTIWSNVIAPDVARRVDCPVEASPYGSAARLSRRLRRDHRRGTVGACGQEHALSGECPVQRCDDPT